MTLYETGNLLLQSFVIIVLYRTLVKLREYTRETKRLADSAVGEMARPCVVVMQNVDSTDDAVLEGQGASISQSQTICFKNIGTAPAVNVRYQIQTGSEQHFVAEGPPLASGEVFESSWSRQALSEAATVIAEFESLSAAKYQTEAFIKDRRWVGTVHYKKVS